MCRTTSPGRTRWPSRPPRITAASTACTACRRCSPPGEWETCDELRPADRPRPLRCGTRDRRPSARPRPVRRAGLHHLERVRIGGRQTLRRGLALHPGSWRIVYDEWEYCEILEGTSAISHADGRRWMVGPGDRFTLEPGFDGVWEVLETTTKRYVVILP
ncbi:cupin domain-containing protein [Azospirillum argentinense]|uniref:cupin domain-containing protein n=1 Tax=Azospirillum argentinense TaxID=2970906 RepID=UPI001FFEE703|nr:cupin domain-containing protein [Azospirillum argentinense]